MKEIQAKSQDPKNRTIRFEISEYSIFPEQIKSDWDLRFSLFRKDFLVFGSNSYALQPI
jgi:hypothetical protein